MTDSMKSAVG